ncbi:MbcA/ParS/Xre antitoxin family protein [Nitrospira moscoviensis]
MSATDSEETRNSGRLPVGISGRVPSEWVADLRRNQWPAWVGIRTQATQEAFDLQQRVSDVLGGEVAATAWLIRKHRALKNKTPLSILGTTAGNARVEQLLKRTKRSPLPVDAPLQKKKTVASRKARSVSTIRKAED